MKKTYTKPELYFESFELSANVASSCAVPTNHAQFECQPIPGVIMFMDKTTGCAVTPDENGLCYQAHLDSVTLFTS